MIVEPNSFETLSTEGKIGILIYIAREKAGMSRKQLAAKINKSVNVIIAIEDLFKERDGRRQTIAFSEIELIASALNLPIQSLLPKNLY